MWINENNWAEVAPAPYDILSTMVTCRRTDHKEDEQKNQNIY